MKTIAMIPARLDSERLPGKLMMDLGGLPIILKTYQNVVNSCLFDEVYVITDSLIIFNLIKDNGGDVFMSAVKHESGSDRIAEFASKINSDIILNVQGDEPFIDKLSLKKLIDIFKNDHYKKIDLASLMQPIDKIKDVESSSNVKVVVDNDNFALYFSRSIIPFNRLPNDKPNYYKHIGVYAFKKEALIYFYNSKPSTLEKFEKLEQLRFLENGKKIKMVETIYKGIGIDTMEDLINARKII
jgi:3-deoxy-manno-octulosonate cytidylyltransferase (CMP-KDO synthetase)|tara:strand:- start:4624 stop:5349 length:726 start_codon:yes stop_codon:yes gene_type:complete